MCLPTNKNERMRDWSEIQTDLLGLIAKRLLSYKDFAAFSGVCRSWRSIKENLSKYARLPWFMLPQTKDSDTRRFFILSKGTVHQRMLPEARGTKCWGSHGWLITIDEDLNIKLLNPLTRRQIQLPHQGKFKKQKYDIWSPERRPKSQVQTRYITKAILSSNPSYTSDYVVIVIHDSLSKLAFVRPGDEAWTTINTRFLSPKNITRRFPRHRNQMPVEFLDIAYYRGQLYAINRWGEVVVCNIGGTNHSKALKVARVPYNLLGAFQKLYIVVESSGVLLVVSRVTTNPENIYEPRGDSSIRIGRFYQTTEFRVLRLDLNNRFCMEVENLGERALFLGHSSSMSIVASDFSGCEANCIYFTDDLFLDYCYNRGGGGKDMGVFNLEDRSIKLHFSADLSCLCLLSPPMWVVPSL